MIALHLLGQRPYAPVHDLQRAWVDARAAGEVDDGVILVEHEPTITVGRARGAAAHVHDPRGMPVIEVERGGDVTWHGPGQLVAYPIVKLEGTKADLHLHLRALEQAMIDVLASVGVTAGRDPRNTGAWVDGRKIGSVGIACRRWVTWHGLALNVAVALDWFRSIEPCGFDPSVMTSLQEHVPSTFIDDPHALALPLAAALAHTLELPWTGEVQHEVPAPVRARLTDRGT